VHLPFFGLVFNPHSQDWESERNHIVFHSARAIFFVDGDEWR
jgi:hypothetical protein